MKKFKGIMLAFTLAICVSLGGILMSGCGGGATAKLTTKDVFSNVRDMYSFAGITSSNFLSMNAGGISQLSNQETADEVVEYVRMVDGMLGGKNIPVSSKEESDNPNYKNKLVTKITYITGDESIYTMYYNESVPAEDDRDADDEDDYEVNTELEGIIIFNTISYNFTGSKEVEGEEIEIEFTVVSDNNKKIKISQEKEKDELEYKYEFINGSTVEKEFEIEFEKENEQLEIEFKNTTSAGEKKYKLKQIKVDGNTSYEIKVNNSDKIYVKIVEIDNIKQYEFTMTDGIKIYYNF